MHTLHTTFLPIKSASRHCDYSPQFGAMALAYFTQE